VKVIEKEGHQKVNEQSRLQKVKVIRRLRPYIHAPLKRTCK